MANDTPIVGVPKEPVQAKCPKCEAQPITIAENSFQCGTSIVSMLWCAGCGHVFHCSVVAKIGVSAGIDPRVMESLRMRQ